MIIRIRIGNWRFTATLHEVTDVTGVNSLLKDGNHILMWDFDNIPLSLVKVDLTSLQQQYNLPNIYILNTGKPNHYIAYCFKRCQWWNAKRIIAQSLFTCEDYFKWGVFRKRWTLRVTPKEGRKPKLVSLLYSKTKEDVNISELTSWVKDALNGAVHFPFSSARQTYPLGAARKASSLTLNTSAQNMRHSLTEIAKKGGN